MPNSIDANVAAPFVKEEAVVPHKSLKTTAICLAAGALGLAVMTGLLAVPGGVFAVPLLGALAGGCLAGALVSHGIYLGSKKPPLPETVSHSNGMDALGGIGAHYVADPEPEN